tara:strand:- start:648 stop:917 length:270 start_codon:yes stop_codon:yes gene_type:complete
MPSYDVKCKKCDKLDVIYKRPSQDVEPCPDCGSERTIQILTVPHMRMQTETEAGFAKERARMKRDPVPAGLTQDEAYAWDAQREAAEEG